MKPIRLSDHALAQLRFPGALTWGSTRRSELQQVILEDVDPVATNPSSDQRHPGAAEIVKGLVIVGGIPRWVLVIAPRHDYHHALPSPGQENPVGVLEISLPLVCADVLPSVAAKGPMPPAFRCEAEVSIPHNTGPIHLQSLDMKLGSDVLEVVGRADIILLVEEPVHGIDGSLDVQGMRLEALSL